MKKKITRLLVITRHPPLPHVDGAGAYLWDMLAYFSQAGITVEVASTWTPEDWKKQRTMRVPADLQRVARLMFPGVMAINSWRWFHWGSFKARWLHRVRGGFANVSAKKQSPTAVSIPTNVATAHPTTWSDLPSSSELRFFKQRITRFKPDILLANFCWLTPALPGNDTGIRTAVLAHDVMSDKLSRQNVAIGQQGLDPATREGEAALLAKADVVIAISEDDKRVFQQILPPSSSIIVATKAARLTPPVIGNKHAKGRVLFVGSRNPPNCEGLQWLLHHVWPLVRAANPEAELHVCGDVAQEIKTPVAGVIARGRVSDLTPEYHAAEVVVVPLLRGTGVKIKLVEAAAHGCAIVTTSIGLQGLASLKSALREADPANAFAHEITVLLNDPFARLALSQAILARVKETFSPDTCYRPALQALIS